MAEAKIWANRLLFTAWATITSILMATLMVAHWYTLPTPASTDPVTQSALVRLRTGGAGWLAVHVLYVQCACSKRILDHLLTSDRPAGYEEKVLLVGEDAPLRDGLAARGYEVIGVGHAELQRDYHIEAAPLLVVLSPEDTIEYIGGYTARKQGPDILDVSLMSDLVARHAATPLPAFGCGVSRRLQALLDPLGLKYGRTEGIDELD